MQKIKVGIQLYTVRDACKADFKGTVKALAEMGYDGVEAAGNYGNMEPEEFAAFLKDLRLELCGQHTGLELIQNPAGKPYAYAKALNCPYLTTSLCGHVEKDWLRIIGECEKAGKVAASQKCLFTYHNHAQEFARIDGQYALDLLYAKTDAAAVQGELDTFWIKKGGVDPVAYIRKYPRRVPQIHLKDMDPADQTFTEVGNGLMDLPGIFAAAKDVGTSWVIVEQDTCKRPPLESAKISIDNLKKAGLA